MFMEGSNLQEEDSIPESQIISKVVSGSGSSGSVPIIKTTANGQTVLLQTTTAATTVPVVGHNETSPAPLLPPSLTIGSSSTTTTTITTTNHHHTNHQDAHKTLPTVAAASQQSMVTATAAAGSMSIVQFQLPTNQASTAAAATMVQSVIQPNHQSVIQPTNPISAIHLPKNVILVNKLAPGSVIQSTESESSIQMVKEENEAVNQLYEDESKRRREILARRPSYRKILNDLSATGEAASSGGSSNLEGKSSEDETEQTSPSNSQQQQQQTSTAISIPSSYIKMLPSIQIGSTQDGATIQGIPTIMTNTNAGSSTIVQYAPGHDGQFIVPDLQTYQLRPPNNPTAAITQNVVMTSQNIPSHTVDEALKKREMRLLKNREAAKECRRKKKEYIKCLENRVAVLENQNKALIDELKTLKELYCKKSD